MKNEFELVKALSGMKLSDTETNNLRKKISPCVLVNLIRIIKPQNEKLILRKLLADLYPQHKQYRRNKKTIKLKSKLTMMSIISPEMKIDSIVSGGGANGTGKKR